MPCVIRRAALNAGGISEDVGYSFDAVADVLHETDRRDDLLALRLAVAQKTSRKPGSWIADSGPLPTADFHSFQEVFLDGLNEVETFLKAEGVL